MKECFVEEILIENIKVLSFQILVLYYKELAKPFEGHVRNDSSIRFSSFNIIIEFSHESIDCDFFGFSKRATLL